MTSTKATPMMRRAHRGIAAQKDKFEGRQIRVRSTHELRGRESNAWRREVRDELRHLRAVTV